MSIFRVFAFSLLASTAAFAESATVDTPHTSVELVSEYEAAAPGTDQWVGVYFKPRDGWHVYWKNPGDSGLPPRGEFSSTPGGSKFGPIEFPTPDRIPYGPLVNYGYEGSVLYPAKWSAPADLKVGENVVVAVNLKWLICKEECVPGKATLNLKLPVVEASALPKTSGTHTKILKSAVASLSRPSEGRVRVAFGSGTDPIEISFQGTEAKGISKGRLKSVFFFPEGEYGIGADAKQVATAVPGGFTLKVPRKEAKPIGEFRGVLKIADETSFLVSEIVDPKLVQGTKTVAGTTGTSPASPPSTSLGLMLLFAFVGGLILNLMPCILPVLSIKVLGLANQSGANARAVRVHGIVFTAGVFVSFWILAAVLLSLRSSGQALGWGFQLQNPIFVGVLAALFYGMALNLFGVFEIGDRWVGAGGSLAAKEGYGGSFFTGVLTTVAATPCSAPFMGSALGFALTQPPFVAVLVLTVLAFGLAFPYLLFSFLPAASRVLPRPGAWMKVLKEVLAFPLLATVVWLASVIGSQAGADGIVGLLTVLVFVTIAVWLLGKPTTRTIPTVAKWALLAVVVVLAIGALGSLGMMRKEMKAAGSTKSPLVHAPWQEWSPEAQSKALAAGKTVFVNFTAEWCVTCKVNETVVFERESVRQAFAGERVVALLADWTNSDPAITAALASVGRNSVPVYLVYKPGAAAPKVLPQILTVDGLLSELR
ncbi:MAG: thioredoxin family protein [Bdellovibrionales bacterium]|nr:thioredoxin family protein [Bdellovibrionales bacterium]